MYQLMPILAILASIFTIIAVLELVRRAQLRAQYALLWLLGSVIILVISGLYGVIAALAKPLGVQDAPWLLLLTVGVLLALIIQGVNTIVISKLTKNNRDLVQRLAILEWYVRQLRKQAHHWIQPPPTYEPNQSIAVDLAQFDPEHVLEETVVKEDRIEEELIKTV